MQSLTKDLPVLGAAKVDYAKVYSCYGTPTLKRPALFTAHVITDKQVHLHPSIGKSLHVLKQLRRAQVVIQHMRSVRACIDSRPTVLVHQTWLAMQRDHLVHDLSLTSDFKQLLDSELVYRPRTLVTLLALEKHLLKLHAKLNNKKEARRRSEAQG